MTTSIGKKQSSSPHEKRLALLSRCLQEIRDAKTPDEMFQSALHYLQEELDYSLIWFCLYDRTQNLLQGAGGFTQAKNAGFLKEPFPLVSGELVEQAIVQMRPIVVPDLRAEHRGGKLSKLSISLGIQGGIIFPLRCQDRCHGVIILGSDRWGILSKTDEKALLSILAGELGVGLHHLPTPQQTALENPLPQLIAKLYQATTLDKRLSLVVAETHQCLRPYRMGIYWFEPEGRYFRQRNVFPAKVPNKKNEPESEFRLEVSHCSGFYQALSKNTLVEISPSQSSLALDATSRLLDRLRVKSLVAVPLGMDDRLFGFLAAEEIKARNWLPEEISYLQSIGQVLSLTCATERIDREVTRLQTNHALSAEVGRVIRSDQDWKTVLKTTAERLVEHLQVQRVLLLAYDPQNYVFSIPFQYQGAKLKEISQRFTELSDVDWRMLEDHADPIALGDLKDDLRFLQWRDMLLTYGVRSLLVCRTTAHLPLEGLLIVTHEQPRSWNKRDLELYQSIAQQLGGLLHQWQLQQDMDQQKSLYQTLQWGLTTIQQIGELDRLERIMTQSVAQLLQAPLALLITWQARRPMGQLTALSVSNPKFNLKTEFKVSVQDVFIQQILETDGILHLRVDQLLPDTLQWLSAPGIEQVIGLALRTNPEDESLGVMIVADQADCFWPEHTLSIFGIFVNQLAWFRRSLLQIDRLKSNQLQLRQLNWYKQFRIIELKRSLELAASSLNALTTDQKSPNISPKVYYQQALGQVNHVMTAMMQILRQEQWQLQLIKQTASLASYLKRSLERIDPLVRQRHLWLQVHAENTSLELTGDIPKLEGVLYQILVFACTRCPEQGRIDIWCRLLDEQTLDLSITDNGTIEPRLLSELQDGPPKDSLSPSALDQQPGMTLFICQKLLSTMGGSLEFYYLEDHRVMSRLVLPFILKR